MTAKISAALAKAQTEMTNATLNKVNPHFKSKYADLAEIRDTVVPVLAKNGIAVTQTSRWHDGMLFVVTTLDHAGEQITGEMPVIMPDRPTPQAMGSALTYARRYALAAIACISADEDDDANAAEEASKKTQQAKQPAKQVQKGNGKVDQFEAFWKRDSYAFSAANTAEWAHKFSNACHAAPNLDIIKKLEDDNADTIKSLDDSLYRSIIVPAIDNAMSRFAQAPLEN